MTKRSVEIERSSPGFIARFAAMASACELLIHTEDPQLAKQIGQIASQEAWRIEACYSRYRNDNLIYQINHANGATLEVDEELSGLLSFADVCWKLSDGAFDITSGVYRKVWHFDGSDKLPTQSQIDALFPFVGWQKVDWDGKHLQLRKGMEIDLGGIGKEYAVDRVAGMISKLSDVPVLINFGGDLRANRPPLGAKSWQVGIENHGGSGTTAILELAVGSLATSGDARRYLLNNGVRYGHVLDPRTGWPAPQAANSATVARGQCIEAGFLATMALLKGQEAEAFLGEQNCPFWVDR